MINQEQFPRPFFWIDSYTVHSYHADYTRRLAIPAVFSFLQESAWHHAASNGFGWQELMEKGQIWALSLMKVKIERLPDWDEHVQLLTWSKGGKGLFAYRDFEMFDASGKKIVTASSAWLILDAKTRRPQRADEFAKEFPSIPDRSSMDEELTREHEHSKPECGSFFDVRTSDIDMNVHVNNVCYVRWALDAFSVDFFQKNTVKEINVVFLAEAREGDRVGVCLANEGDKKYRAAIVREADKKELAKIRLLV
ncbi:MAG: hypothetical protein LBG19_00855 [Prevotellaceae bacterium]|jgi:acyl-ACP thioesterase|nr:hypothetical protein [Prevotellaceae bacterium]